MIPMRLGSRERAWPILLLLIAVIVPTVSMLWFMLAAIDNEGIAVQQRLLDAYPSPAHRCKDPTRR